MSRIGPLLVERVPAPTRTWVLAVSVLAVAAALAGAGVIFWAFGINPLHAYAVVFAGTLADRRAAPEILRQAIPLLLCGVGLVMAFRAQFWNIGAEGQLLVGAVAATGVALFVPLSGPLVLPAMFLAGFTSGALWGLLPTLLRLRLDVNEVISTLMMNYIALFFVDWLIHGPWKGTTTLGFAYTDTFPEAAWIPVLAGTRVHWPTLALGLALAGALAFLLARTRLGFEIRILGENPTAARYAGIDPVRTTVVAMLISAGAAGLAGAGEVGGIHHRLLFPTQVSLGYGYAAIIVAWLARGSPLAAILTALFLGLIFTSGDVMKVTLQMPFRVTDIFNGLILFFLIGSERLLRYRMRWVRHA
ncbi:MAG: ABC transporter permease [Armatimonadota bacterium]|nr:ABC transporter permease [Armatimonadota bacterium]MDR7519835.1 ABC transporter permease [Armatimonadota bacterium]MDR7550872.1 ABC transporter permease [Armatimonadota bacterium]